MIRVMTEAEVRALPVSVDVETAGRAFGMGRTKAHELAREGKFPCRVVTVGPKFRVPTAGRSPPTTPPEPGARPFSQLSPAETSRARPSPSRTSQIRDRPGHENAGPPPH